MTSQDGRLRALVVEDEWPARNYLVELLEGSGLAEVVGAVGTADEARQALGAAPERVDLDVVFLDVQLAPAGGGVRAGSDTAADWGKDGLEIVRGLAAKPGAPLVVLATASREHALEAFELGVLDYLLKPFSEERVEQCLRRILERRPSKIGTPAPPQRIVARRKRNLIFLEADEVWAFEAAHRLTFVHTPHGTFDLDLSLSAIEASFGRRLTRVHRNWLVNPRFVKELEREGSETRLFVGAAVGQPGVHVPVSRERASELKDLLLTNATGLRRA
ncbi:Response regulator of zinc sigma-54-dependent two-component system [Labilithrix luteola]|uniref:Response regulator of zinc sigma-54-dependent two-component system n=1 Tax=Labilithrix luteola TaxID=1391654 RepID=A0A0K1Q778_9BACT|nr:LytTR family DNA-binding domain-containing protein [Labilithrix luteola]AKV01686.1 Response regulator of zinc sigma-54-dependent two-component system [Labilithrix luteola]